MQLGHIQHRLHRIGSSSAEDSLGQRAEEEPDTILRHDTLQTLPTVRSDRMQTLPPALGVVTG